jgi:predicted Zn-dependent peptidase
MNYQTHTLPNGLRIIYLPKKSEVTFCGITINAGSRDENREEEGCAHFAEHLLFKGTRKKNARQIINRLEDIGGELNAYTSKEETVVYAAAMKKYTRRMIELMADMTLHSIFPQKELEKEREVILDEIASYHDNPSELIFDDFEELIFKDHPLGHNILGNAKLLKKMNSESIKNFVKRCYQPNQMVVFVVGNTNFEHLTKWCEEYFVSENSANKENILKRNLPEQYRAEKMKLKKRTHQIHSIIGNRCFDLYHPNRLSMYLLNNILGGPGMNSLLNLSLREKYGLVYTAESNYQPFTDCGWWCVYYACDEKNDEKCEHLVLEQLQKIVDQPIPENKLKKYKQQLIGQMTVSRENTENLALSLGKSYMRFGKMEDMETMKKQLETIQPEDLQETARVIFNVEKLSVLKYY